MMVIPQDTYLHSDFLNYMVKVDDNSLYSFMNGMSRKTLIEIMFLFRFGYIDYRSTEWTSFLAYAALLWYLDVNPQLNANFEWVNHVYQVGRKWESRVIQANEKGITESEVTRATSSYLGDG